MDIESEINILKDCLSKQYLINIIIDQNNHSYMSDEYRINILDQLKQYKHPHSYYEDIVHIDSINSDCLYAVCRIIIEKFLVESLKLEAGTPIDYVEYETFNGMYIKPSATQDLNVPNSLLYLARETIKNYNVTTLDPRIIFYNNQRTNIFGICLADDNISQLGVYDIVDNSLKHQIANYLKDYDEDKPHIGRMRFRSDDASVARYIYTDGYRSIISGIIGNTLNDIVIKINDHFDTSNIEKNMIITNPILIILIDNIDRYYRKFNYLNYNLEFIPNSYDLRYVVNELKEIEINLNIGCIIEISNISYKQDSNICIIGLNKMLTLDKNLKLIEYDDKDKPLDDGRYMSEIYRNHRIDDKEYDHWWHKYQWKETCYNLDDNILTANDFTREEIGYIRKQHDPLYQIRLPDDTIDIKNLCNRYYRYNIILFVVDNVMYISKYYDNLDCDLASNKIKIYKLE